MKKLKKSIFIISTLVLIPTMLIALFKTSKAEDNEYVLERGFYILQTDTYFENNKDGTITIKKIPTMTNPDNIYQWNYLYQTTNYPQNFTSCYTYYYIAKTGSYRYGVKIFDFPEQSYESGIIDLRNITFYGEYMTFFVTDGNVNNTIYAASNAYRIPIEVKYFSDENDSTAFFTEWLTSTDVMTTETPTKDGFKFAGWYTSNDENAEEIKNVEDLVSYADSASSTTDKIHVSLYAHWTEQANAPSESNDSNSSSTRFRSNPNDPENESGTDVENNTKNSNENSNGSVANIDNNEIQTKSIDSVQASKTNFTPKTGDAILYFSIAAIISILGFILILVFKSNKKS